tara:strand:- start:506 stop:1042 length:537 start_codon:yes stop_codon:yes gene_type:complete
MKKIILIIMALFNLSTDIKSQETSIYDFKINGIDGSIIDFKQFKGKYILFVNVASKCGFTSQYEGLELLFQKYKEKLIVIGFPCNQFGSQEPGNSKDIIKFCTDNYGVSFLLSEKIDVKGKNINIIYKWLTNISMNGKFNSSVKWNFQKYLVNPNGELINYFYSTTKPMSEKITSLLK